MYGLTKPRVLHKVQDKLKEHLTTLMNKERDYVEKEHLPSGHEYRWNLLQRKHRMPSQLPDQDKYFLKTIDGVQLAQETGLQLERVNIIHRLIDMYELIPSERERMEEPRLMDRLMEDPVECPVCPARDGHGPRLYTRKEVR